MARLLDGLYLAATYFQLTIAMVQGCYHSDPDYLVNIASIKSLQTWLASFQ